MHVTSWAWRDGAATQGSSDLDDVAALLDDPHAIVWVDLLDPTADDFAPWAKRLDIDQLAVEDALTLHERPKSLRYGDMVFVTAYTLDDEARQSRISLFVMPGGLLTIRLGSGFDVHEVAHTVTENSGILQFGCRALELMVLDAVVDGYTAQVNSIDERVDDLEDVLFDRKQGEHIATQTFALHKEVGRLRRIVLPMRDVAGSLVRRTAADQSQRDLLPFAEDVYDHTMRAADWTDGLRDAVESVRSTNLALMDNQMNVVMKKLTGWAAIIAVPTAITGYFGQNVPYPGFGKDWGFWLSLLMMLAIAGTLWAAFKRNEWI